MSTTTSDVAERENRREKRMTVSRIVGEKRAQCPVLSVGHGWSTPTLPRLQLCCAEHWRLVGPKTTRKAARVSRRARCPRAGDSINPALMDVLFKSPDQLGIAPMLIFLALVHPMLLSLFALGCRSNSKLHRSVHI